MGQIAITTSLKVSRLSKREQLLVLEIGGDVIDSASAFVSYISESYGFSKSSVWYNLNRLKEKGTVDFATKEELGKGLSLTKHGSQELHLMIRSGIRFEDGLAPNDPQPGADFMRGRIPNNPLIVHAFSR